MKLFDKIRKPRQTADQFAVSEPSENLLIASENMLKITRSSLSDENSFKVPLTELNGLGAAAVAVSPLLKNYLSAGNASAETLYRLANYAEGDMLKKARNGNYWGAFKTSTGSSKFVQLQEVDPRVLKPGQIPPIDPATFVIAAALYSIEKDMAEILEMEKQILSFLEQDKEAEIEADLKMLTKIMREYKYNYQNQQFIANHQKLTLDIKRTSEKNMIFYQKQVSDLLKNNNLIDLNMDISNRGAKIGKKFQYYRLSLYIYSLSSLLDLMLIGNFSQEYLTEVKNAIVERTKEYNALFVTANNYVQNKTQNTLEANAAKGIGFLGKQLGQFIGSIPIVKDGPVDEWLVEGGKQLEKAGQNMNSELLETYKQIGESGTETIICKFDDLNRIFNGTSTICMDNDFLYLIG